MSRLASFGLIIAVAALILTALSMGVASAEPVGYAYFKTHTIIGSTAENLTNYVIPITFYNITGVDNAGNCYLGDHVMQARFQDLCITNFDGSVEFPIWHETGSYGPNNVTVWVNITDTIPKMGGYTIRVYYGSPNRLSNSNGSATFPFFDDFSGSSMNTTGKDGWTVTAGSPVVSNGICTMNRSASDLVALSKTSFGTGYEMMSRSMMGYAAGMGAQFQGFSDADATKFIVFYGNHPGNPNNYIADNQDPTAAQIGMGTSWTGWHKWHIYRRGTYDAYYEVDTTGIGGITTHLYTNSLPLKLAAYGGSGAYLDLDWIAVRPYFTSSANPTANVQPLHGAWSAENSDYADPVKIIVLLGTSLTYDQYGNGMHNGIKGYGGWILDQCPSAIIVNSGVPGDNIGNMLADWNNRVVQYNPDYVIMEHGCNDERQGYSASVIETDMEIMEGLCEGLGATLILTTGAPRSGTYGLTQAQDAVRKEVNDWIINTFTPEHDGRYYIDLNATMSDPSNPSQLIPEYTYDGTHYTTAGYTAWGSSIDCSKFVDVFCVNGTVRDSVSGRPLSGVNVSVYSSSSWRWIGSTTTSADGKYSFNVTNNATVWTVESHRPGYSHDYRPANANNYVKIDGVYHNTVDVSLTPVTVMGTLVALDANGASLPAQTTLFNITDTDTGYSYYMSTDVGFTMAATFNQYSNYTITAATPGYKNQSEFSAGLGGSRVSSVYVGSTGPYLTFYMDLQTGTTYMLSGNVYSSSNGAPISGATVSMWYPNGTLLAGHNKTTNDNGYYSFQEIGIPDGTYSIRVNAGGYITQSRNLITPGDYATYGSYNAYTSTYALNNFNFAMSPTGGETPTQQWTTFNCRMLNTGGTPPVINVGNTRINLTSTATGVTQTYVTDLNGNLNVQLSYGSYTMSAYSVAYMPYGPTQITVPGTNPITLWMTYGTPDPIPDVTPYRIGVGIATPGTWWLRVAYPNGTVIVNATIMDTLMHRFTLGPAMTPGTYNVSVSGNGVMRSAYPRLPDDFIYSYTQLYGDEYYWSNSFDMSTAPTPTPTVTPQPTPGPGALTFKGHVKLGDGTIVNGAYVVVSDPYSRQYTTYTANANGYSITINAYSLGTYSVYAGGQGYQNTAAQTYNYNSWSTSTITVPLNFTLTPNGQPTATPAPSITPTPKPYTPMTPTDRKSLVNDALLIGGGMLIAIGGGAALMLLLGVFGRLRH